MYRAMLEEEGVAVNKGLMRRAEPDKEAGCLPQPLTMSGNCLT